MADPSHRVQISSAGGTEPTWSPDGKRILYRSTADQLISVEVDAANGGLRAAAPQALFELQSVFLSAPRNVYDIMPNGKRVVVVRRLADEDVTIHVRTGVPLTRLNPFAREPDREVIACRSKDMVWSS